MGSPRSDEKWKNFFENLGFHKGNLIVIVWGRGAPTRKVLEIWGKFEVIWDSMVFLVCRTKKPHFAKKIKKIHFDTGDRSQVIWIQFSTRHVSKAQWSRCSTLSPWEKNASSNRYSPTSFPFRGFRWWVSLSKGDHWTELGWCSQRNYFSSAVRDWLKKVGGLFSFGVSALHLPTWRFWAVPIRTKRVGGVN